MRPLRRRDAGYFSTMSARPYETRKLRHATTTGWRPTCNHGGEPVPCTVLDPFLGSGTTALVADRLGRDAIGIELNPAYAEMARRRVYEDAPLFADVSGPDTSS